MSRAGSAAPTLTGGHSALQWIAAVAVLMALAGLAAYAMFSGPTTVSVRGPAAAPVRQAPPPSRGGEPESRGGEGGRGD